MPISTRAYTAPYRHQSQNWSEGLHRLQWQLRHPFVLSLTLTPKHTTQNLLPTLVAADIGKSIDLGIGTDTDSHTLKQKANYCINAGTLIINLTVDSHHDHKHTHNHFS